MESTTQEMAHRYLPLWSAGSNAFLGYRIETDAPAAEPSPDPDGEAQGEDQEAVRETDRAILTRALVDSRRALERGNKYVAVVPLHAASLKSDYDRQWILAELQQQPDPLPKLIVLELIDSQAIRWTELTRYVWSLHKACRRIVLRQALDHLPWFQAQHLPPQAIGVSAVMPDDGKPERDVIKRMDAFMESARKRNYETYLYGLRTRSLAFAAIGAGFTHVSGPVIAQATQQIGGVTRAEMDMLFG